MKRRGIKLAAAALALSLLCTFPAAAAPSGPSVSGPAFTEVLEEPQIQSEGAVVIDGSTGAVLYGKNQNTRYYPASITKLMTALLVLEHCGLDEVVTFSETATTNLESGAVSLGLTAGDQLTVRQCLYALLLKSANEVGNGLAEHVSGSVSAFADLMNQKAASLGCTGTHFTNPHGLNDANHYTTPYDMALIARAAFQNPTLREIDTTLSYQLPATKNAGARTITMGHKMMYPTDSRYYEGIIGGKTGYTSKAGNTLVTGAEKNGVQVIAVVMKSSSTHYQDTKKLLDYGFARLGQTSQGSQTSQSSQTAPGVSDTQTPSGSQMAPGQTASGQQPSVSLTGPSSDSGIAALQGPGMQPQTSVQPSGQQPSSAQPAGWYSDGSGWRYRKDGGQDAAGEWLQLSAGNYWIDETGYMANGWRMLNGTWYYFGSDGIMDVNQWKQDAGKWFYLGADGAILKNAVTPDGYTVGADGVWIA